MENSDCSTEKPNLSGVCDADKEHFGTWQKWYEICFDKNGRYIEENEKIFQDLVKRHGNKVLEKETMSQTSTISNTSKPKQNTELSF